MQVEKRENPMADTTGRLTTHVLDTATGRPAAGMRIELFRLDGDSRVHLKTVVTNDDGRCDGPILSGADFSTGVYELCLLYTSPSPRDKRQSRMPSSA